MAFPQVASVTLTQFGANTTTHNVNMPATVNAGDLLLILFSQDDTSSTTEPSGWTTLWDTNSPTSAKFVGYGKDAAGTEGGTTVDVVSGTSQAAVAQVFRITGWRGTLGTDVVDGTPSSATGINPDPPSVTPGWTEDTLWIACFGGNNDNTVSVFPTNYGSNQNSANSGIGAGGCTIASCTRELNAASDDPGTFTWSENTGHVAQLIAVRPAAASTPFLIVLQRIME